MAGQWLGWLPPLLSPVWRTTNTARQGTILNTWNDCMNTPDAVRRCLDLWTELQLHVSLSLQDMLTNILLYLIKLT